MKRHAVTILLVLLMLTISACGAKEEAPASVVPTNTPQPTATEIPKLLPADLPPEAEHILEDSDASLRAYEKRTVSGDNILNNLFERPFTSEEMDYQPDLNILNAVISSDEDFYYFTLILDGVDPISGSLTGAYGIEFDRTQTGRGDLLVWVKELDTEWSMRGLTVYYNDNDRVGGTKPIVAEEGYEEPGYTDTLTMEGDKVAWAKLSPEQPSILFIAVSRALLDDPEAFLWNAWADGGVQDPALFDYDDHFGPGAAGSPINTDADYPLKALYSLDNTCRQAYGSGIASDVPGACLSGGGGGCWCAQQSATGAGCLDWDCD